MEALAKNAGGHSSIIKGTWVLERPPYSFQGVVAPPYYQVRCVFK